MKKLYFILAGVVCILIAVNYSALIRLFNPNRLDSYCGNNIADTLRTPSKIEVFRLDEQRNRGDEAPILKRGQKNIAGYPVLSQATVFTASDQKKIQSIVSDRRTYGSNHLLGGAGTCLFKPIVAFVFHKRSEQVSILFCFSCNQCLISGHNKDGKEVKILDDFKAARSPVLVLTRRVFPKDSIIAGLR